jgi:ferric-dicitrate binding protein FerR (iron transport regulator)
MKLNPIFIVFVASIATSTFIGCASKSKDSNPDELEKQRAETSADFQNLITDEIDDPARAENFAALSAEREQLISQHATAVQHFSKRLKALSRDYSTERQSLENLIQEYNVERRAAQTEFLALMGRMKATVTAKEWEKLAKFELKELNPRTMSYQAGGQ